MHSRRSHTHRSLIALIIIVAVMFWLAKGFIFTKPPPTLISPLAEMSKFTEKITSKLQTHQTPDELVTAIKQLLDKQTGIYSVYVYDLQTQKGFGYNDTTIFTAASVNKLPVLAALYSEAENGKIDLDDRVTIQARDIQDYGTGIIRYQGAGTIYSIKSLAQLLTEKSDNTAAFVLTNIIGENRIQALVDQWGLTQTDIANNKTSNKDMAQLLTLMYQGKIADQAHTEEMIGFLDESDFENRLPALLPKDTKVYHKIGNEIGNVHDVGIVVLPNKPYYIGVLSNDVIDDTEVEQVIAKISKMVYDYMSKE